MEENRRIKTIKQHWWFKVGHCDSGISQVDQCGHHLPFIEVVAFVLGMKWKK